jgi:hypothetical protein
VFALSQSSAAADVKLLFVRSRVTGRNKETLRQKWIEEATVSSGGETTSWTDSETDTLRKFYKIEMK